VAPEGPMMASQRKPLMPELIERKISIFNWNGKLLEEMRLDAKRFGFAFKHHAEEACMGHHSFTVLGTCEALARFSNHYELEFEK
jgi:hypothetical protein